MAKYLIMEFYDCLFEWNSSKMLNLFSWLDIIMNQDYKYLKIL